MYLPGLLWLLTVANPAQADSEGNPIAKIIELITEFQGKIIRDGEAEQKAYEEYFEWCDDASKEKGFEVKTGTAKKEKLTATLEKAGSDIEDADAKIEELSSATSTDEKDLKAATEIREKEHKDFSAEEAELSTSIDMLGRAIGVLEKELKGSSFLQTKVVAANAKNVISIMNTVIDAASFSSNDKQKLLSLVQSNQGDDDDLDGHELNEASAPAPTSFLDESKKGGILDMLEDMKEKAEAQLSEARKAEMTAKANYDMLKLSLTDKINAQTKEMDDTKAGKAEAEETKATAEGELEGTTKELAAAQEELHSIQMDCMEKASDHEVTVKGRTEELKALATTKKIIQQATSLEQVSLIQLSASSHSRSHSKAGQTAVQVASLVRRLAKRQHSRALAQLASRIEATVRYYGRSGDDPFAKVKNLIQEMIAKLMKEAQAAAEEKAYCDTEMGKTEKKKQELTDDIEAITAKIDNSMSASKRLKGEVKKLQAELLELEKMQEEMDKARADANAAFLASSGDLSKGLDGLRKALKVLRDYYAKDDDGGALMQTDEGDSKFDAFMQQPAAPEKHKKSSGAGDSIIGMLEVAESDFAKNLAEEQQEEDAAQTEYEKATQENKLVKTSKEQDVKYKTKEFKALDKSLTELSTDRDGMNTELDAVLEYYDKIKEKCIAKPEPYEERKKRREAEIAGLKDALAILEGEAAFIQRH